MGIWCSSQSSSRSLRSVSAVSTSSAEKGSSISSTSGFITSARAKPTRLAASRPTIRAGRRISKPPRPMMSMASTVARSSRFVGWHRHQASMTELDILLHGQPGEQSEGLEHHRDAVRRAALIALPRYSTSPPFGLINPAMMRSNVDLPEPDLPSRATISPLLQGENLTFVQHDPFRSGRGRGSFFAHWSRCTSNWLGAVAMFMIRLPSSFDPPAIFRQFVSLRQICRLNSITNRTMTAGAQGDAWKIALGWCSR